MRRLIARAQQGDSSAKDELVRKLQPRLASMARYYKRCTGEDDDDLLGEGWYGMLRALPEVDLSIGAPEQFLVQRARWQMLDYVKRRRRAPLLVIATQTPAEADPGNLADSVLLRAAVVDVARQVSSVQREILGLLVTGHTFRQVAQALGCTSANVAYHVRVVRRRAEDVLGYG